MTRVNEEQELYRRQPGSGRGVLSPRLETGERKRYRVKVFKSGNSVALRLPAELGLQAGAEMELRSDDGEVFTFEPAKRPRRKLNVAKFWGIEPDLQLLSDEERLLAASSRPWDDPDWAGWPEDRG